MKIVLTVKKIEAKSLTPKFLLTAIFLIIHIHFALQFTVAQTLLDRVLLNLQKDFDERTNNAHDRETVLA